MAVRTFGLDPGDWRHRTLDLRNNPYCEKTLITNMEITLTSRYPTMMGQTRYKTVLNDFEKHPKVRIRAGTEKINAAVCTP